MIRAHPKQTWPEETFKPAGPGLSAAVELLASAWPAGDDATAEVAIRLGDFIKGPRLPSEALRFCGKEFFFFGVGVNGGASVTTEAASEDADAWMRCRREANELRFGAGGDATMAPGAASMGSQGVVPSSRGWIRESTLI